MASRVCWNCGKDAHQEMVLDPILGRFPMGRATSATDIATWCAAFQCDACARLSIGLAEYEYGLVSVPAYAKERMDAPGAELTWLPPRMLGMRFNNVPHPIDAAASEAWACYSVNQYRASVLMARAVVEAAAKEKGFENGRLVEKIDQLRNADIISKGVTEAAHEIRFIGNEMAHGDFVTEIGEEECSEVLTFLEEFLTEVYERPARLGAFKARRLARKPGRPEVAASTELPARSEVEWQGGGQT